MKKLLLMGMAICGLLVIATGCVTPINVGQVLQLPEDSKIYTSYNIWYEIPWDISSINYQRGKIIPFGTEVKIISAEPQKVTFQVIPTGRQYSIIFYEKWAMQPVEAYIKQLVTPKTRSELTEGIAADIKQSMLLGEVKKGMTRKEVTLTYGPPSPHRTPLLEGSTWIYWKNRYVTKRIIFKNDKVVDIID